MFILTSAMRSTANADPAAQANANTFKKKAMTEYILEQGGLVFDDFAVSEKYKFPTKNPFLKNEKKCEFLGTTFLKKKSKLLKKIYKKKRFKK